MHICYFIWLPVVRGLYTNAVFNMKNDVCVWSVQEVFYMSSTDGAHLLKPTSFFSSL